MTQIEDINKHLSRLISEVSSSSEHFQLARDIGIDITQKYETSETDTATNKYKTSHAYKLLMRLRAKDRLVVFLWFI